MILIIDDSKNWIIGNLVSNLLQSKLYGKKVVLLDNGKQTQTPQELDYPIAICGHGDKDSPLINGQKTDHIVGCLKSIGIQENISIDLFSCHTGMNGIAKGISEEFPNAMVKAPNSMLLPYFPTSSKIEWHIVRQNQQDNYTDYQNGILDSSFPAFYQMDCIIAKYSPDSIDANKYIELANTINRIVIEKEIYLDLLKNKVFFYQASELCISCFQNGEKTDKSPNDVGFGNYI